MHELAITQSIVEHIEEHLEGSRVVRVVLEIGALSAIVPDAVRFCFDVCARGTNLEGATLEIIRTEGTGGCRACGRTMPLDSLVASCACGSTDVAILRGQELRVRDVEVV
ncbi:[NiFe] hydrogenase nickel incorporation protein HypA [Labilithrix luteola]|uniref:Hydrogenase maturation factor HypA n=1 Tax=Labilithrix luteola TaxID=1391654 RepID=A0A0K1QCI8_9BACT|nr:hydrogenase maturation nickel metallochaperone HypA [Labilithrix luteola]AKV03372.1 [NiFe] hydrogenase nickel incorporation protein HypA [Labilithrix luteola]